MTGKNKILEKMVDILAGKVVLDGGGAGTTEEGMAMKYFLGSIQRYLNRKPSECIIRLKQIGKREYYGEIYIPEEDFKRGGK
jgi:hypothetical protein